MLILLALSVVCAAPPPPPSLAILAPPSTAGRLRDQVWPAFSPGRVGRWVLVQRTETAEALTRQRPPTAGAIWASAAPEGVVIHRVLFDEGTHLQDRIALPADAPADAVTEAVRLRLRFILDAPLTAGQRWQAPSTAPPLPAAPPPLTSDQHADLVTRRAPPVPRRTVRVPDPPPPLPPATIVPDERLDPTAAPPVRVRMGLGLDGLWSSGGWDAGLHGFVGLTLGERWATGLEGGFHPFHDLRRGGRPVGVSGYRATAFAQRRMAQYAGWRWGVRAGLGISGLSAVGADTRSSDVQPTLLLSVPLRFTLTGPFALALDPGLVVTPGATRARHGDAVLVERGAVQVRTGVVLSWTIQ